MKTIGLLGGMSWKSTQEYYRILNEEAAKRLGGLSSALILLHSVNLAELHSLQELEEWEAIAAHLGWLGRGLRLAGADFLVVCANTMHRVAEEISLSAELPVLHIGDAAASAIKRAGLSRVGLLGTLPTMEQEFLRDRFMDQDLEVLVPESPDRELIHRVIFEELCRGELLDESRAEFVRIIKGLQHQGAQGVVLGCTEIPLLIRQEHVDLPLFDTLRIHALAAIERALEAE
ncbi:MAG: aspartate/glutamate racemase family protein [Desulfovibrio sp.]